MARTCLLRFGIAAFAALISSSAFAQASGNPENGLRLARQWCTGCHVVEPAGRGGDSGPPFHEVANWPDRTEATMRAWLTTPHPPMPNLSLSRGEINDIIAYLDSLQGRP
jgi:cytochrome c2